jgi:hypothetical protein
MNMQGSVEMRILSSLRDATERFDLIRIMKKESLATIPMLNGSYRALKAGSCPTG